MRKYRYLVGYKGDKNVMYGKYYLGVNNGARTKPSAQYQDYSQPMTLNQAQKGLKKMPCKGAVIYELVEIKTSTK